MGESFEDRWGKLSVGEIKELNEKARITCEWEATAEGGNNE